MNRELCHRLQMLSPQVLRDYSKVETALLTAGWSRVVLKTDLREALAWTKSHLLSVRQDKAVKKRQAKQERMTGDAALESMFASAGIEKNSIPHRGAR